MKTWIDVQREDQSWMLVGCKKLQLVWLSQTYTIVDVQVGRRACLAYNRKTRMKILYTNTNIISYTMKGTSSLIMFSSFG